ncbi:MAG: hypothetical protein K6F83_08795 [Clostridiales bacterium]|nr:hypothetical protein [Clostridiales bacterium]
MSVASLFLILLILALPVCLALTLAVYFIYRFFYNKHLTKAVTSEVKLRKWLPPFAVILISLFIFISASAAVAFLLYGYKFNTSTGSMSYNDSVLQITEKDGKYYVTSNDGILKESQSQFGDTVVNTYMNRSEVFITVDIKDEKDVAYFVVNEDGHEMKIEYKKKDDLTFLNPVPIYITLQDESESIEMTLYDWDDNSIGTVKVN